MTRQPSPTAMLHPGPLEQQYRREGYADYYEALDAQVCTEMGCECGAPKTRYVGLFKLRGGQRFYRALSHCDVCGLEVEF